MNKIEEGIFERLFILENIKNPTKVEKEEYKLLKSMERKREVFDEEDEEEYGNEAERVGMTETIYGWM